MRISPREAELLTAGRCWIVGCDEVGRGALAGPVVAAAVVLDYQAIPDGLADSKQLTRAQRERLAQAVRGSAIACAVCSVDARTIERINILQASLRAMALATRRLGVAADAVLVDGLHVPPLGSLRGRRPRLAAVVDGDALIPCIAAASIVAKVERDALMRAYHRRYARYGFLTNVGYGTPDHLAALREHGPCPQHRRTFRPVREVLEPQLALGFGLDAMTERPAG